jgi:predicted nucleic acid-binding protein
MIMVDSCGWLEFLTDGPLAQAYERYFERLEELVTPTIVLYEVYKKIKRERGEENALLVAAQMHRTLLAQLTPSIALYAADLSMIHRLPMADAIVYATALTEQCQVVTSDQHFAGLAGVVFVAQGE